MAAPTVRYPTERYLKFTEPVAICNRLCTGLFHFTATGAAGTIAGAATGAAAAIRAADALFAAFLGLPDKPGRKAKDQDDNGNNDVINRIHRLISFR